MPSEENGPQCTYHFHSKWKLGEIFITPVISTKEILKYLCISKRCSRQILFIFPFPLKLTSHTIPTSTTNLVRLLKVAREQALASNVSLKLMMWYTPGLSHEGVGSQLKTKIELTLFLAVVLNSSGWGSLLK